MVEPQKLVVLATAGRTADRSPFWSPCFLTAGDGRAQGEAFWPRMPEVDQMVRLQVSMVSLTKAAIALS